MTIKEVEQIEDRARRRLPVEPEQILTLTVYLREVLQAKANAEAFAHEAAKRAGIRSHYRENANLLHPLLS